MHIGHLHIILVARHEAGLPISDVDALFVEAHVQSLDRVLDPINILQDVLILGVVVPQPVRPHLFTQR